MQASRAQQESAFLHVWQQETSWNAAAVGRSSSLQVNTLVKTHAAAYENAGTTLWAGVDMPFYFAQLHQGGGISLTNDAIGLFSQQQLALQYALHRKFHQVVFSLGGQALLLQSGIDGSKASLGNASDPAFPTTAVQGSGFDLGWGMMLGYKNWSLSLSVNKLLASDIRLEQYLFQQKRNYNALLSYRIEQPNAHLSIMPLVHWRSDFVEHRFDIAAHLLYRLNKNALSAGVNYAPQRSLAFFLGGTYQNFSLSYAYEAFTSALGLGAGQHEVWINYRFALDITPQKRNKHKSARWL